jgi:hypothetical protein
MKTALLLIAPLLLAADKPPDWKAYAKCAAAYQVNAEIKDPDRAASMTQQIAETAGDYLKAAKDRYRGQTKADAAKAEATVGALMRKEQPRLRKLSREKVEKAIEACPQLDFEG